MKFAAYQSLTFFLQFGRHTRPVELVDCDPELARRIDHHLGGGEQAQIGLYRAEVGFNLARLGLAGGRELAEDCLFESILCAEVTEHPGHQHRDSAEQDEGCKQLRGQAPACGSR